MPFNIASAIGGLVVGLAIGIAAASLVFYPALQTQPMVTTGTSTSNVYTTIYTSSNPSPCTVYQGSDGRVTTTCTYSPTVTTTTQYLTVTSTQTITVRTGS